MSHKTTDGIRLSDCARVSSQAGIEIRQGTNHPYILNSPNQRPCPLASSTNARTMLAPWLARATGRKAYEVYAALRRGDWEN